MKKLILINVFTILFVLMSNAQQSNYTNYTKSWYFTTFLPNSVSGGGSVSFKIENNILTLTFNAGFVTSPMKLGDIVNIGTSDNLPDLYLGVINYGSSYQVRIKNNYINVYSDNPVAISNFNNTIFTVDLLNPNSWLSEPNFNPINSVITPKISDNQNYIYKLEPQKPDTFLNSKHSVSYIDELGRIKQSIGVAQSPLGKDQIQHIEYDNFGRQNKEYLISPSNERSDGSFIEGLDVINNTELYYQTNYDEDDVFAEKLFENSPLNKLLKQGATGSDWVVHHLEDNDHSVKYDYQTNIEDEVPYYRVTKLNNNIEENELILDGYYSANTLYKTIIKDENWQPGDGTKNTTEEFKDDLGRIILTRTYGVSGLIFSPHDTYYVYDDYGNLSYVLTPKTESYSAAPTITEISELCYQYKYDKRKRLIEKKLPGKEKEYIIYNKHDQEVLTQDGNLRVDNKWVFNKYDALGRVIYSGIFTDGNTRQGMQEMAYDESDDIFETRLQSSINIDGVPTYYSNTAFPFETETLSINKINYYDDYIDIDGGVKPATVYGVATSTNTKGLVTVTKTRVLEQNDWITTVTYYDDMARPIYVYTKNNFLNTINIVESKLDFRGKILESKTTHKRTGYNDITTIDRFDYDHTGRLVQQTQSINNQPSMRLYRNNYDEVGQLKNKLIGNGTKDGFKDLVGVTVSDGIVTKIDNDAWGNGGFATNGTISGDGYIEFEVLMTSTYSMIGLSSSNVDANFSTIKYAIYADYANSFRAYELGYNKGTFGTYQVGDVFRIERVGNTIYYKKNGETFYTATTKSNETLLGDVAIRNKGRKIKAHIVSNERGLQKVDYNYNIRGWLTNLNDVHNLDNDLFSFSMSYNNLKDDINGQFKPMFNGNISEIYWKTENDNYLRSYTYKYDELNRLNDAYYSEPTHPSKYVGYNNTRFVKYDKNGNITYLKRYGSEIPNTLELMDQLYYTYEPSSNKLKKVLDSGNDYSGFKDGVDKTTEFTYDANGNLITDKNKDISEIKYNYLNLPKRISIDYDSEGYIEFIYDANGEKMCKRVYSVDNNYIPVVTDYAGNFVYQDGELQFFGHPEGYIIHNAQGKFDYVFQYKDQVGNVRLSYTDANKDGEINTKTSPIFYDDMENSNGWDSEGSLYGSSATTDGTHTKSGSNAAYLYQSGHGEIYAHSNDWIAINNTEPTDYIFSGWLYAESPGYIYARISFFMNEDTETNYFTQVVNGDKFYTKDTWIYYEKRVTVPVNIDKINLRIDLFTSSTYAKAWFDNLSIRKVNNDNYTEIIEENNYYPFGLKHKGYNTDISSLGNNFAQKYKTFQGQEFTDNFNLNVHEWKFRFSDPSIGRFWQVDPLAEEYVYNGVYNFSENRLIDAYELEGKEATYLTSFDVRKTDIGYVATWTGQKAYPNPGGRTATFNNYYLYDDNNNLVDSYGSYQDFVRNTGFEIVKHTNRESLPTTINKAYHWYKSSDHREARLFRSNVKNTVAVASIYFGGWGMAAGKGGFYAYTAMGLDINTALGGEDASLTSKLGNNYIDFGVNALNLTTGFSSYNKSLNSSKFHWSDLWDTGKSFYDILGGLNYLNGWYYENETQIKFWTSPPTFNYTPSIFNH